MRTTTKSAPTAAAMAEIQSRIRELTSQERDVLIAIGAHVLGGRSTDAAAAELRRLRDELEGLYSAVLILERDAMARDVIT